MNRKTLSFVVVAALFVAGCSPAADTAAQAPASQPVADAAAVDVGNTVCPVSGDKVGDSKLTSTYDGKLYHFCCDDCPKAFAKDPAKFAKPVAADPAKYGVKSKT